MKKFFKNKLFLFISSQFFMFIFIFFTIKYKINFLDSFFMVFCLKLSSDLWNIFLYKNENRVE